MFSWFFWWCGRKCGRGRDERSFERSSVCLLVGWVLIDREEVMVDRSVGRLGVGLLSRLVSYRAISFHLRLDGAGNIASSNEW